MSNAIVKGFFAWRLLARLPDAEMLRWIFFHSIYYYKYRKNYY